MIVACVLACGAPVAPVAPTPAAPDGPLYESIALHVGETVHFERVPASARLEQMRTSLAVGGAGHRASGRWVLVWDDGATEVYEGPFALGGCSRGLLFRMDGMDGHASVHVERRDCPPEAPR